MYETEYEQKNHFSFGENWKDFLDTLDDKRINSAKGNLLGFLGGINSIRNKSFLDIGSGSGLSSLAAYLARAKKIVSFDVDKSSVACTHELNKRQGSPKQWRVTEGSILDDKFVKSLGRFDIVYSWGVLHHTGNMYQAIDNCLKLLAPRGVLYIAIYNRFEIRWYGGRSEFWLKIKKLYNRSGQFVKNIMLVGYMGFQFLALIVFRRENPIKFIKNYRNDRGMSWKHDLIDWLGGLPYEYAGPDEIINYLGSKGLACKKLLFRNGNGCNEYLFVRV